MATLTLHFDRNKLASEADVAAKQEVNTRKKEFENKVRQEEARLEKEAIELAKYDEEAEEDTRVQFNQYEQNKDAVVNLMIE